MFEFIFNFFFENEKSYRFQGFSSEPGTISLVLLPTLIIILDDPKIKKIHLIPVLTCVLMTQSIYGYLGLLLIFINKFYKYKLLFLILILSFFIISYQSNSMKIKIYDSFKYASTILNKGWDQKKYEDDAYSKLTNLRYSDLNIYKKYLSKEKDDTKHNLIKKILKKNQYNLDDQISEQDKYEIISNNIFVTLTYINASSCSYLYNAFITLKGLKDHMFTGIGLGNYYVLYNQFSDEWKFKPAVYTNCYLLNAKDGKTIYLRLLAEFGIIFYLIFIILVFYFYFKTFFSKDNIAHAFYICFLLKILQLGSYTDIGTYLFLTISIKIYNVQKYNVRTF